MSKRKFPFQFGELIMCCSVKIWSLSMTKGVTRGLRCWRGDPPNFSHWLESGHVIHAKHNLVVEYVSTFSNPGAVTSRFWFKFVAFVLKFTNYPQNVFKPYTNAYTSRKYFFKLR